jgi:hypothetical protein
VVKDLHSRVNILAKTICDHFGGYGVASEDSALDARRLMGAKSAAVNVGISLSLILILSISLFLIFLSLCAMTVG